MVGTFDQSTCFKINGKKRKVRSGMWWPLSSQTPSCTKRTPRQCAGSMVPLIIIDSCRLAYPGKPLLIHRLAVEVLTLKKIEILTLSGTLVSGTKRPHCHNKKRSGNRLFCAEYIFFNSFSLYKNTIPFYR